MSAFQEFQPGSIVSARGREWIVLPESDGPRLHLRSLGGSDDDVIVIHAMLERDPPKAATFRCLMLTKLNVARRVQLCFCAMLCC